LRVWRNKWEIYAGKPQYFVRPAAAATHDDIRVDTSSGIQDDPAHSTTAHLKIDHLRAGA